MKFIYLISIILVISGCSKKDDNKNKKLAQTYYKLCMVELSDNTDKMKNIQSSYRKALEYIQESINFYESAENLAIKGTILFRLGDYEQSCKFFQAALAHKSSDKVRAGILNNYACLLAQMGQVNKALDIFNELEKNHNYFTPQAAVFNRGKIFFDKMDYEKALDEFSKAVKLAPEYTDAHYFSGLSALKLDDKKRAQHELETVLFLDPTHDGALKLVEMFGLSD